MLSVKNFQKKLLVDEYYILRLINELASKKEPYYISVIDIVVLKNALNNTEYNNLLNSLDALICDSSFMIFVNNLKKRKKHIGLSASDLFANYIEKSNYKQLIVGSTNSDFNLIKQKSSNDNLFYLDIGFKSNYADFNYELIEKTIINNKINILWVMLGNPKQDYVSAELKSRGRINCVVLSSGAAYLFYLNIIKSNNINLFGLKTHWLNRIVENPKRQLKRVLNALLFLPKVITSIK